MADRSRASQRWFAAGPRSRRTARGPSPPPLARHDVGERGRRVYTVPVDGRDRVVCCDSGLCGGVTGNSLADHRARTRRARPLPPDPNPNPEPPDPRPPEQASALAATSTPRKAVGPMWTVADAVPAFIRWRSPSASLIGIAYPRRSGIGTGIHPSQSSTRRCPCRGPGLSCSRGDRRSRPR